MAFAFWMCGFVGCVGILVCFYLGKVGMAGFGENVGLEFGKLGIYGGICVVLTKGCWLEGFGFILVLILIGLLISTQNL